MLHGLIRREGRKTDRRRNDATFWGSTVVLICLVVGGGKQTTTAVATGGADLADPCAIVLSCIYSDSTQVDISGRREAGPGSFSVRSRWNKSCL